MTTEKPIDTDFAQFQDAMLYGRRSTDQQTVEVEGCDKEDCPAVFVLERRVDRHRDEIDGLKKLMEKNTADTTEILGIVTTAKGFFRVAGWLGDKLVSILAFAGTVIGLVTWYKSK